MDIDTAAWYQKVPGSDVWYRTGVISQPYRVRACDRCGQEALIRYRQRFCSLACSKIKDVLTYMGAHDRVRRVKGHASEQACLDCGGAAAHWSYDGQDPDELTDPKTGWKYSVKPEHYEPRCVKCHGTYDITTRARGERNGYAKLTNAQVRGIKASVLVDENGKKIPQRELAEHFGVSQAHISKIRLSN